jgi:hypothetical protein
MQLFQNRQRGLNAFWVPEDGHMQADIMNICHRPLESRVSETMYSR